jgi:hypothetical protein
MPSTERVRTSPGARVGVGVGDGVRVGLAVAVGEEVGVGEGVAVGCGVDVAVGVGLDEETTAGLVGVEVSVGVGGTRAARNGIRSRNRNPATSNPISAKAPRPAKRRPHRRRRGAGGSWGAG